LSSLLAAPLLQHFTTQY